MHLASFGFSRIIPLFRTSLHTAPKVWHVAQLKPHLIETFKLGKDPLFSEKVINIIGLYMNPPNNAFVFSVDEK